ncbi:type II CRISPR-associated endonuclease Cas1 [Neisseriaceae bacterium B1]
MTWRTLLISNGGKLSLHNKQLLIQQNGDAIPVPLEDLAIIVIEHKETVITTPLLSALAQRGIALITCDEQFLPCGQWLPLAQYHRPLKTLHLQLNATLPQKKQLWQKIVQQKILNQAFVLNEIGADIAARKLHVLAEQVKSGDSENKESQAAALYFQAAFGREFTRAQENAINAHLNYGYSVLRSAIARALVQYGWLPALGLHHHNQQNPFNLADDFIEPFRPLADLMVHELALSGCLKDELTPHSKQQLVKLLHYQMRWQGQIFTTLGAIDRTVASFQAALIAKKSHLLRLPEMVVLKEHCYE